MELNQYQELAMRTAKALEFKDSLVHGALGVTSEAGELATAVKAHVIYGKPLDYANVKEELGDLMWFAQYMASMMGWTMEEVACENIAKLQKRYPDKYSDEAAIARADKGWRDVSEIETVSPDAWIQVQFRFDDYSGFIPWPKRSFSYEQNGGDNDIVRFRVCVDQTDSETRGPWVANDTSMGPRHPRATTAVEFVRRNGSEGVGPFNEIDFTVTGGLRDIMKFREVRA